MVISGDGEVGVPAVRVGGLKTFTLESADWAIDDLALDFAPAALVQLSPLGATRKQCQMVESKGIEPMTSTMPLWRSTN